MTRQAIVLVRRCILACVALGILSITIEALVRGKLQPIVRRAPTALYTRTAPWRGDGSPRAPLPVGTADGSPLEQRTPVALDALPKQLVQAVLAVEDQRFFSHHGLDFKRIGGALVANLKSGSISQGGSTVTQQLAKNLFLSSRRTPLRKLREAALALALEARYSKSAILEAYLNEVYLGQDGGRAIHGVGAASRYYFGKDVRRLTLAESALLAGMIRAPNRTSPTRNPEGARARRDLVLRLMVEQRRISRAAAERANSARISTRSHPQRVLEGRWFRDYALAQLGRLPARGVAVQTTLDAALQSAAERAVRAGLQRIRLAGAQAALLALDPRNGDVLAMIGGRDYGSSQFNRATEARRQPGSAFKPVVALAALERSGGGSPPFTLASVVEDEPLRVRTRAGTWQPDNYDRQFRGPVTLREAMEQSLNVPFARIGLTVGPERITAAARRLGITSPLDPVPSLALGSSGVTLLELVRAYGTFAAAGTLSPSRTILGTGYLGQDQQFPASVEPARVMEPAVAFLVTSMLEGVTTRGTGRALNGDGRFGDIAGKTGTTNDTRDAWFVAYSPSLVVGVWVGFDDERSLGLTGATAALPIVARFLEEASSDREPESFEIPEGITEGYVTLASAGWWKGSECGAREYFLNGTEPDQHGCGWFELPQPRWEDFRRWGGDLKRQAAGLLERIAAEIEELRSRR